MNLQSVKNKNRRRERAKKGETLFKSVSPQRVKKHYFLFFGTLEDCHKKDADFAEPVSSAYSGTAESGSAESRKNQM